MLDNNQVTTQLTYTIPLNVAPQYVIGMFGCICNQLGVENTLPSNMALSDLPETVILEDRLRFQADIMQFLQTLNIWSATYQSIKCQGALLGNQLNLFFTLNGTLPENVILK